MIVKRRNLLLTGGALCTLPMVARANYPGLQGQDVEISPTTLSLGSPGDTTICMVLNNGTESTSSQIRLKLWRQDQGQDVLEDTEDIVASPPFMTIDPGSQQVVRIANLGAVPGQYELAYRLLLNELPSQTALTGTQIQVLLAFSVPLFIAGEAAAPPNLTARFADSADGIALQIANSGDVHAKLSNLSYRSRSGSPVFAIPGLAGYVLAHSVKNISTRLKEKPAIGGILVSQTQLTSSPTPIELLSD